MKDDRFDAQDDLDGFEDDLKEEFDQEEYHDKEETNKEEIEPEKTAKEPLKTTDKELALPVEEESYLPHCASVYHYLPVFQKISKFLVIDYNKDKEMHYYFNKVIIGIRSHKELSIDPVHTTNDYSMIDFVKFLREAFSLERDATSNNEDLAGKKPRILIVARKQYRAFTNLHEITQMYLRDHPMFKDPMSFHQQGHPVMRSTFMDNQDMKLDIKKFKNADVVWH
ncbi:hypothetical protein ZIOFF_023121 [Zingiber officinale]|uniref:Uncharacterized protein n=1 Tax=Zingiber officinale TaxID=94328 RepID=A0A8J5HNV3_ZINOF|nr:hypothetical protein ZIOFF_023121 [Zingiber officinale]